MQFSPESVPTTSDIISSPLRNNFNTLATILAGNLGNDNFGSGNPLDWGKVLKTGSNLTEIETRAHSALSGIGADDHHARLHDHSTDALGGTTIKPNLIAPTGNLQLYPSGGGCEVKDAHLVPTDDGDGGLGDSGRGWKYLRLQARTVTPAELSGGMMWYNSDDSKLYFRKGSTTYSITMTAV